MNQEPQKRPSARGFETLDLDPELIAVLQTLLDLMGDGEVGLSQVEMFVLDEADRMLDMGFLPDVRRITQALPPTARGGSAWRSTSGSVPWWSSPPTRSCRSSREERWPGWWAAA